MSILNLYFMQASIKECMLASQQDRYLLCTLQPSRILTMLLSMLTSAAMFRYPSSQLRAAFSIWLRPPHLSTIAF